jgi:hypothetical protein
MKFKTSYIVMFCAVIDMMNFALAYLADKPLAVHVTLMATVLGCLFAQWQLEELKERYNKLIETKKD